jgi:hypothetical protein
VCASREQLFAFYTYTRFLIYALVVGTMVAIGLTLAKHYDEVREKIQYDSIITSSPRYNGVTSAVVMQATPAYEAYHRHGIRVHRFLYPMLSGLIGAQNVLFAKCSKSMRFEDKSYLVVKSLRAQPLSSLQIRFEATGSCLHIFQVGWF